MMEINQKNLLLLLLLFLLLLLLLLLLLEKKLIDTLAPYPLQNLLFSGALTFPGKKWRDGGDLDEKQFCGLKIRQQRERSQTEDCFVIFQLVQLYLTSCLSAWMDLQE